MPVLRLLPLAAALLVAACDRPSIPTTQAAVIPTNPEPARPRRHVRATGTVQAVKFFTVVTPQIQGQGGPLTLTYMVASGSRVKAGDTLAEFDGTQQADAARDAKAKFEDLGHQVEQRRAQNRADAERRLADLQKAEADLGKARLQLRRGPLLAEIDRLKNEARAEDAQAHVASLRKSHGFRDVAEAAALRILELQRDRQKVALERANLNSERLIVKAPLGGMVALETIFRSGSMGHAQEGDQMYPGQPLVRIFDPSQMEVFTQVNEPDGAVLVAGARAKVRLDAYPDLIFDARFDSASPVATSALGSPIKTFAARFRIDKTDPHLLPDLSAAVIIEEK